MSSNNISRDELQILLSSMGIVLPKDNKLPTEELNRRFGQALNTSQEFSDVIENTPINLSSLPKWFSRQSLFEATQRGNLTEALAGVMSQPKKGHLSSKEETFKEMRQSILLMAHACDVGIRDIFFVTDGDKPGISIRVCRTVSFIKTLTYTATDYRCLSFKKQSSPFFFRLQRTYPHT